MSTFIDIHVLQSVPPSNLNRDDMGSPKTAIFGGVRRARVSSQSWKRAARLAFREHLDPRNVGYRTTRLVDLITKRIETIDPTVDQDRAEALGAGVLSAMGLKQKAQRASKKDPDEEPGAPRTEYLVFLSADQIDRLARLALDAEGGTLDKKAVKAAANTDHSFDIALFGRMVADDATLNVDAAAQVAHALSTHVVDNEFDYYTAVDDENPREDTGAGMIGTIEFNSATLYRYTAINVDQLVENLGDHAAAGRAASAFVDAFVRSMPSGKRNTFANGTLPDCVVAVVRSDQPISMVGAFENPVSLSGGGWMEPSAAALANQFAAIDEAYGNGRRSTLVMATPACGGHLSGLGDQKSLPGLVSSVEAVVVGDQA